MNYKNKIILLAGGFVFAFLIHSAWQCESEILDYGTSNPSSTELDVKGMEAGAEEFEKALLAGDADKVKECFSETTLEFYKSDFENLSSDDLKQIGQAISTRVHTVESETYAEFEYVVDGLTYSIGLTLVDVGNWEITRF